MSSYGIGFALSLFLFVGLLILFRYEERTGVRFFPSLRARLDYAVVRSTRGYDQIMHMLGRDSIRQIFHYLLHAFLRFILYVSTKWEDMLRSMMRINKTLAKSAERDRTTRSKLEEIALHKAQNALTPAEKKKYKDKMLEG